MAPQFEMKNPPGISGALPGVPSITMIRGISIRLPVPPNRDLDDGKLTNPGEYSLADDAYAKLLARLAKGKSGEIPPELRANILCFYSDLSFPIDAKKDKVRRQGVLARLDQLKWMTPDPALAATSAN
jgi:hypothetical protein